MKVVVTLYLLFTCGTTLALWSAWGRGTASPVGAGGGIALLVITTSGTIRTTHEPPLDFCPGTKTSQPFAVGNDVLLGRGDDKEHWARVRSLFGTRSKDVALRVNDPRTDTYISGSLLGGRATWEPDIAVAMRRALQGACSPDKLVVDVGANVGYFSAIAAADGCSVVSFEPVPRNVRALHASARAMLALRQQRQGGLNWTIYRNAVSDVTGGQVQLETAHATVNAGNYKINTGGASVVGSFSATTVRLDDVIHQDVAFLKIDTEGYEAYVIAGAARLFHTHRVHVVVLELMHDVERSGCDWKDMLAWFKCMGYTMRSIRTGAMLYVREREPNILFVLGANEPKRTRSECLQ